MLFNNRKRNGLAVLQLFVGLCAGKIELVVIHAVRAHTRTLRGCVNLGKNIVFIELVNFGIVARNADVGGKVQVVAVLRYMAEGILHLSDNFKIAGVFAVHLHQHAAVGV